MKAISTKYLGPTTHKPARVKAYDLDGNSVTISWPGEKTAEANYIEAVKAFLIKFLWGGHWAGGSVKNSGCVFVCYRSGLAADQFTVKWSSL